MNLLPVVRKRNIVIQELPEELLIYDLERNRAICLNQTARLIYEQCDGKTTFAEAAKNINQTISDEIFWITLEKFKTNKLLDETEPVPNIPKVSRRDLMRGGLALSMALPIVSTLVAPTAAKAQSDGSCVPLGQICSVVVTGENLEDNCCTGTSCTMQVNGFCCIVQVLQPGNEGICDPQIDFCCPTTSCDPVTLMCV